MKIHFRGHQFARAIFLLLSFQSTNIQTSENKKDYKTYFQQQEKIYQELVNSGIPGARPLNMDEILAESVLANCPLEINTVIFDIEENVFCDNEKNIMLHGMSGTGKSAIAQAIAIKCQIPCLFFNAGDISTEYMNSGVQNLSRICEHARKLEKRYDKPCVVIFDELEALTKKHVSQNNNENNILISFWQQLDKLSNSRVVVIGTMNRTEDVPVQITNRTSMIEVPLPNLKHREAILSYYLKAKQDKYGLRYSESLTSAYLARETKEFSNRDLQNVVARATRPVIRAQYVPDGSNKFVMDSHFDNAIDQIKKNPKRKLEREMGTLKHAFKMHFREPKTAIPAALGVGMLIIGCASIANQIKAMRSDYIARNAAINCSILGIPVGLPVYCCKKGWKWTCNLFE